jgi:competence protein ComEC
VFFLFARMAGYNKAMENRRILILFFSAVLLILNFFTWQQVFALQAANLEVYFLDVGQGDSQFIETPDNRQIIIDGGPGDAVLGELGKIMSFSDRKIDIVVLSHPETDHMQGLVAVLKKYKADYILQAGVERDFEGFYEWQDVLATQQKQGAKIINVKAGDVVYVGAVVLKILAPFEDLSGVNMEKSSNEACLVAKLSYGTSSFLFTGDIGFETEAQIGKAADCDVLKVGHHGSKYSTSESFLAAISPQIAVIEVGKNSYGHPTAEILQRLAKFGIQTLRTDKSGTIKIVSNGDALQIQ